MRVTRPLLVAACGAALVTAPCGTDPGEAAAIARDGVVSAGTVDPRVGPARRVGATYRSMVRAWGPPLTPARDIPVAFWPDNLEVTLRRAPAGAAVKFWVTGPWWRTAAGVRPGDSERRLRRVYRRRLVAVPDVRRARGVRRHWMVVRGRNAIGFVMRPGRVAAIITGRTAVIRQDLRFAGPV